MRAAKDTDENRALVNTYLQKLEDASNRVEQIYSGSWEVFGRAYRSRKDFRAWKNTAFKKNVGGSSGARGVPSLAAGSNSAIVQAAKAAVPSSSNFADAKRICEEFYQEALKHDVDAAKALVRKNPDPTAEQREAALTVWAGVGLYDRIGNMDKLVGDKVKHFIADRRLKQKKAFDELVDLGRKSVKKPEGPTSISKKVKPQPTPKIESVVISPKLISPKKTYSAIVRPENRVVCKLCRHIHERNRPDTCIEQGKCLNAFRGEACFGCFTLAQRPKVEGMAASKPVTMNRVGATFIYLWRGDELIGNGFLLNNQKEKDKPIRYYANRHNVQNAISMSFPGSSQKYPIDQTMWLGTHAGDLVSLPASKVQHISGSVAPLPVGQITLVDGPTVATFVGLNPKTRDPEFSGGSFIVSDKEIYHNVSTGCGSCGGVLFDKTGSVIAMHWRGDSGDKEYPNAALPINPLN